MLGVSHCRLHSTNSFWTVSFTSPWFWNVKSISESGMFRWRNTLRHPWPKWGESFWIRSSSTVFWGWRISLLIVLNLCVCWSYLVTRQAADACFGSGCVGCCDGVALNPVVTFTEGLPAGAVVWNTGTGRPFLSYAAGCWLGLLGSIIRVCTKSAFTPEKFAFSIFLMVCMPSRNIFFEGFWKPCAAKNRSASESSELLVLESEWESHSSK